MIYLETQKIVKKYFDYTAINQIDIQVPKGSVYGLLGPNGAGKTTLIRIINHIIAPDSGQVYINGQLSRQSDIFNIGYLPEERGLYKKMKVEDQIIFLAGLKGLSKKETKKRICYWFDKFSLSEWKDRKVEELSKGMQQKVQFIAAIIHDPDLLILDEPFSGFDPVNAELLKNEILELKKSGKTIILSTHNMESVESLCDKISLLNKSEVVLGGEVADIQQQYKTNCFNIVINNNTFDMQSSLFSVQKMKIYNKNLHINLLKQEGVSNSELLKEIANNYEIISFKENLPSMNEIFIKTVTEK